MLVNPQCLFARNIIELGEFNADNTQEMHPMLVQMDAKELQIQVDENTAQVDYITNRRWRQAYSIGHDATIGAVSGVAFDLFMTGLDMYLTGRSWRDDDTRQLLVFFSAGTIMGGIVGLRDSSFTEEFSFDRQRLDRLQAKINTLSHKMQTTAEMPENDKRQLEIANIYFTRLMSQASAHKVEVNNYVSQIDNSKNVTLVKA